MVLREAVLLSLCHVWLVVVFVGGHSTLSRVIQMPLLPQGKPPKSTVAMMIDGSYHASP
jgi:hypothetical protein